MAPGQKKFRAPCSNLNRPAFYRAKRGKNEKKTFLSQLLDHNQTDPAFSDTGCGEIKRRSHTYNAVN